MYRQQKTGLKRRRSLCCAVYVSTATSSSLKALSHSFCPAACWVQSVISWLILSVTALKHKGSHTGFLALTCVLCMHAHAGLAHIRSHTLSAASFERSTAGLSLRRANSAQECRDCLEFAFSLAEHRQALAKASIFLIRQGEVSQAQSPAGPAAWLLTSGRIHTPSSNAEHTLLRRGIQMQQWGRFCDI